GLDYTVAARRGSSDRRLDSCGCPQRPHPAPAADCRRTGSRLVSSAAGRIDRTGAVHCRLRLLRVAASARLMCTVAWAGAARIPGSLCRSGTRQSSEFCERSEFWRILLHPGFLDTPNVMSLLFIYCVVPLSGI